MNKSQGQLKENTCQLDSSLSILGLKFGLASSVKDCSHEKEYQKIVESLHCGSAWSK